MSTESKAFRLTLRFVTKPLAELRATEFVAPTPAGPDIVKARKGKAGDGFFEWREGTQALSVCLLRYLCYPVEQLSKGIAFVFEGSKESPAKTMDGAIAKSNSGNCWQMSIFGGLEDGTCRLGIFLRRHRAKTLGKTKRYKIEVQHTIMLQTHITVEIDGNSVADQSALKTLADDIEDPWYSITGNPLEWEKVKASRQANVESFVDTKAPVTTNPSNGAEDGRAPKILATPPTLSQATNPLLELFKSLSISSIKTHLIAALMPARGSDAAEKCMAEFLSPECANLVAERLVNESIESFCDFYYADFGDYDSSAKIKKTIARVITSHPEFRTKVAAKVAECQSVDMLYWFVAFSRFYEREMVIEVEREIISAAENPAFHEKFTWSDPKYLTTIIEYFSVQGCVVAVRILEKIKRQAQLEQSREA